MKSTKQKIHEFLTCMAIILGTLITIIGGGLLYVICTFEMKF